MLKRISFLLLRASLLHVLIREFAQRRRVTILMYHAVAADVLDRHLAALGRCYHFITLAEYLGARAAGALDSLPPKALVLTVDDGMASNRALLPVLQKHRIRPTIFLCTRIVGTHRRFWFEDPAGREQREAIKILSDAERLEWLRARGFEEEKEYPERQALSWEEVEAMREWVDFQPHSLFHPILPRCTDERARDEIVTSRRDMEARGFSVRVFAYPNGDYTERETRLLREAGYEAAVTIDTGFNSASTDRFRLKRIGIEDTASVPETLVRASGLWSALRVLLRGRYQTVAPPERTSR